jgi:hypothetical protein
MKENEGFETTYRLIVPVNGIGNFPVEIVPVFGFDMLKISVGFNCYN